MYVDPKLTAASLGTAAATLLWTLLATFVGAVAAMPAETLAVVTGATALLLSIPAGWAIRNAASPLPADQRPGEVEPLTPGQVAALEQADREARGQ